MNSAREGNKVKVHFTGRLENGEVFDTSKDREPLEFTIGTGTMMPGFEKGILGMAIGDLKTFTIVPEEAYGLRREELIATIDKSGFPHHITPELGQQLQINYDNGEFLDLAVTEMDEDTVTLDANHALAGKTLTFEVELLEFS